MRKLGIGVLSLVGVPGVVFAIAYGMGCSNDAENSAMNGNGVKGAKCPDDGNPCTIEDCSTGLLRTTVLTGEEEVDNGPAPECHKWVCVNGAPKTKALELGDECALSAQETGHCSASQVCVECTDNSPCVARNMFCYENNCVECVKDGVACGNSVCIKCNGDACNLANECASGSCTDGVCCNEACQGTCESCKLTDKFGTCTYVPNRWTDGTCSGGKACDGNGVCKALKGSQCGASGDCLSGLECVGACLSVTKVCVTNNDCNNNDTCLKLCRLPAGEQCLQHEECGSLKCNGGNCQSIP